MAQLEKERRHPGSHVVLDLCVNDLTWGCRSVEFAAETWLISPEMRVHLVTDRSPEAKAIAFLRERLPRPPRAVLILGSGLGVVGDELADPLTIPYAEIPGFPRSTVPGHAGSLLAGLWQGVEMVVMRGRFHLYEGWVPEAVVMPLRVFRALGAEYLIVTNAAGGVGANLRAGDLMLIADHIDFMFRSPLKGSVAVGEERFPDMSNPYDHELRAVALETAVRLGVRLVSGVYAGVLGPSYETPSEIGMLRRLGADAVGMSTVPEVVVARALGMRVLGISCVTNLAAGTGGAKLTHEEVVVMGGQAAASLTPLLRALVPRAIPPASPGGTAE